MPSEGAEAETRLATILRDHRDGILGEWAAAVRASESPSASLPERELRDDVPAFLDRIADALERGSDSGASVDPETTGKHARHRLRFGVELRHLIHEYQLLRRTLLGHAIAAGCARSDAGLHDLVRLNDMLDYAMTETVAAYARERDRARDLLLGVIGHDLRNPLTAVSVGSSSLLHAKTVEDARVLGGRIKRSAERIQRVIADLLDLARARFGARMPVNREPIDLGEVARATVEELQLGHPDRQLVVERDGDLHGLWDRVRMGQMVSNLVGNAIQHGRDPITVSVAADVDDVVVRVSNRGEPIPEAALPSLFEPFRRGFADNGDKARLGLGLFIVAEIVRRHAGTIEVRSAEDETVFTIRLPRRAALPHGEAAAQPFGPV